MAEKKQSAVRMDDVAQSIVMLRGQRVLLDSHLATLYQVETRLLVQAVKRNIERFPDDFMFQLTTEETGGLKSQSVISNEKPGRGGRRYAPYAFTEQGVAMLSGILNSPCAIAVNIEIMRAFVRLRGLLASNKVLARKLDELAGKVDTHDEAITAILSAIRELMTSPKQEKKQQRIGFIQDDE